MAYWHVSKWIRMFYPEIIWNIQDAGKKIFLTFDDGPTPRVTEKVLNMLDSFQAKATFFCLGRNVERHPEIYNEILQRGHMMGNHTYSHIKGWKTKDAQYIEDIELATKYIKSSLFRPPYGQIRRSQIAGLQSNYRIVMWEVMSHDYEHRVSKERSLKALLRYTKEGSILVFHDSVKAWPKLEYILPKILAFYSEKGFGFEKIEEKLS